MSPIDPIWRRKMMTTTTSDRNMYKGKCLMKKYIGLTQRGTGLIRKHAVVCLYVCSSRVCFVLVRPHSEGLLWELLRALLCYCFLRKDHMFVGRIVNVDLLLNENYFYPFNCSRWLLTRLP